jgi:protocatechuate 3,4-dioxygenase beta subunit
MRAWPVFLLVAPAYVAVAQQRPARDAADAPVRIIQGQVRSDDDSAALLRRARVTVAGSSAPAVFTDQEGRFEVAAPGATTTLLRISKPGFAPAQISVSAAAAADLVEIRLARGAAIVGHVFDEVGSPAVGAEVRVRRVAEVAERGSVPINVAIETDDLGEFRIGSLPAGAYDLFVERHQVRVTGAGPDGNEIEKSALFVTQNRNPLPEAPPGSPAPSAQKTSLRLRAGEEVEAALFHNSGEIEARGAASFASAFEAERQQAEQAAAMSQARGTAVAIGRGVPIVTNRGNAILTGRVTAPNGRGVAGAVVRLNPASAGTGRVAASNARGQFQFVSVPPGAYRLAATKTGLIAAEYGQDHAAQPGRVVTLRDRQRLDRIDIRMLPGAVVTGTVTDPDGEPMEGLALHVWRLRLWNGRRITEAATDVAVHRTDDRGRYRLHGLQPGTYYVVASEDPSASSREVTGAPRSFYPGAQTIAEASTVRVDAGLDADGIHVTFNPARAWRLEGRASDSENHSLRRPLVLAGSTRSGVTLAPQMATMTGYNFAFEHVPPGSYVIHAIQRLELPDRLLQEFAMQFIDVTDHDVTRLNVITSKGATVAGRILVEGDRAVVGQPPFLFDVISADADFAPPPGQFRPWTVRITPDWRFQVDGLNGPVRFTSSATPVGWFLKSVDVGGRNAADEAVLFGTPNDWRGQVNVVFSSAGAEIAGRAVNGRNEPVGTYVVVAFPVDRGRWSSGSRFIKTAQPDEDARFTLGTLPPGDYWVAAVDALFEGSIEDPERLDRLSTIGRRVTLSAGQRMVVDLPLVRLAN